MKERPILFSGPMVRAILEGRKTVTRRAVKFKEQRDGLPPLLVRGDYGCIVRDGVGPVWQPYGGAPEQAMPAEEIAKFSPYGAPGDRLWVRENAFIAPPNFADTGNLIDADGRQRTVSWAASADGDGERCARDYGVKPTPSIHMPRWACRIILEVVSVRLERLQEIGEDDAKAEGVESLGPSLAAEQRLCAGRPDVTHGTHPHTVAFGVLWDSLNYARGYGWITNPWVWIVEFKRLP